MTESTGPLDDFRETKLIDEWSRAGAMGRTNNLVTCERCGCVVERGTAERHLKWHREEGVRSMMAMPL